MKQIIEDSDLIIGPIQDRLLKHNQNFLMLIAGPTGSGKSYSALTMAREIDPSFNIDRVVFRASEFMEILNDPSRIQKGQCIVWDECGCEMAAREFATLFNRLIQKVLQTFRHRNIAVIFTIPNLSFVDIGTRKLLHGYMETISINRVDKECVCKFMNIQTSPRLNLEPYFKYSMIANPRTLHGRVTELRVPMPPKSLIEAYEEKRKDFTNYLNKLVQQQLTATDRKAAEENFDAKATADLLADDMDAITMNGKLNIALIQAQTKLGRFRATMVRNILQKRLDNAK